MLMIKTVVMMMIVMAYDKNRDDDDSDIGGMNDMIFRSTNIYYNQHHDISHMMHLHDEILMDSDDNDNNDDTYDHDNGDYNKSIIIKNIKISMIAMMMMMMMMIIIAIMMMMMW